MHKKSSDTQSRTARVPVQLCTVGCTISARVRPTGTAHRKAQDSGPSTRTLQSLGGRSHVRSCARASVRVAAARTVGTGYTVHRGPAGKLKEIGHASSMARTAGKRVQAIGTAEHRSGPLPQELGCHKLHFADWPRGARGMRSRCPRYAPCCSRRRRVTPHKRAWW